MSVDKYWCWEIEHLGYGPDYFCVLEITSESAAHLDQIISHVSLKEYKYAYIRDSYCSQHQQICSYHLFVDEYHAEAILGNIQGTTNQNIWIYNIIELHRGMIKIECGYGGGLDHSSETAFLIDLCNNPNLVIKNWSIFAGGQGYDYKTVQQGNISAELKHYITGKIS